MSCNNNNNNNNNNNHFYYYYSLLLSLISLLLLSLLLLSLLLSRWEEIPPMSYARASPAVAASNGKIYAIGDPRC